MMNRIIPFIIGIVLVYSCTDEDNLPSFSIGGNFIKSLTTIAVVDTFSVQMSTILIDSIQTSNSGSLLVGNYYDDYFGMVSSTGYFQIGLNDSMYINDKAIFDSLTLELNYTGTSFGDTLKQQTIYVYRVLEDIEENDDLLLYNTSSFYFDDNPLGSIQIIPKPNFYEKIEIRLPDELGEEFLNFLLDDADEFSTTEKFHDYFKGLVVGPGLEDASILGFKTDESSLNVKLYTHYAAQEKVEETCLFPIYSQSTCFNNISADRSGTFIDQLKTQKEEILSAQTGNMTFVQAGTGIISRLDFPGLATLLELDIRKILYKAELVLKPVPNSYSQISLPDEIILYDSDKYNNLLTDITLNDEGVSVPAEFYFDKVYGEATYYKFDITDFILEELSDAFYDEGHGLIVRFPDSQTQGTLKRLVFDGRKNSEYRTKLKLYFMFYD